MRVSPNDAGDTLWGAGLVAWVCIRRRGACIGSDPFNRWPCAGISLVVSAQCLTKLASLQRLRSRQRIVAFAVEVDRDEERVGILDCAFDREARAGPSRDVEFRCEKLRGQFEHSIVSLLLA
jgi:hypothetical protein